MSSANSLLARAESHLGYTEGPRDNQTPFGAWAGTNFQPWCCAFTSKMEEEEGVGIGKIAFCPTGVVKFRNMSRLHSAPERGDQFFLWFPNKGRYAHTGLVKFVEGDWMITVEGNSNKAGSRTGGSVVSLRRKWRGTKTVFGRPAFTENGSASAHTTPSPPATRPTLVRGSNGDHVRFLQERLIANGHDLSQEGGVDGDFGPGVDREVRAFQTARGLEADGVVGPRTWAALGAVQIAA
jgi:hypothetical protein